MKISLIDEITEEANAFLEKHDALMELIDNIIHSTKDILSNIGQRYKMKIYLSKDMEVENWEEIVLAIGIEEEDFRKIIKLWDKIEEEAEDIIGEFKIDRSVEEKLRIKVDRFENV